MGKLSVVVDGAPMSEDDARAFWERFSAHMETNKGDLAGFATAEGFASVRPVVGPEGPSLVVSRSAPQGRYETAPKLRSSSGSPKPQGGAPKGRESPRKRR